MIVSLDYNSDDFPSLPKKEQKAYRIQEDGKYKFILYKRPILKSNLQPIVVPFSLLFEENRETIAVLSMEKLDIRTLSTLIGKSVKVLKREDSEDIEIVLYMNNKKSVVDKYDGLMHEDLMIEYLINEMIDLLSPYYDEEKLESVFK